MARMDKKTQVLDDGLRYKSKVPGSIFTPTKGATFSGATMSCFFCGKHRSRSVMETRKIIGKTQAVCSPNCKDLDERLKAEANAS